MSVMVSEATEQQIGASAVSTIQIAADLLIGRIPMPALAMPIEKQHY
jgi:hypothetical protein